VNKGTILRRLSILLPLIPAALLGLLIAKYSVNVPLWDEWEPDIAGIFEKHAAGHLRLHDLLAQHNETRLFFPRLLFLLLGGITHWNVRYEMVTTLLLALLILLMVYRMEESAFGVRPRLRLVAILLSSLLIFSPAMYEAWLWGMEISCFVPLGCLLGGLLIARTALPRGIQLLSCIMLATIATYSFGNGFLVWIILTPALFFSKTWEGLQGGAKTVKQSSSYVPEHLLKTQLSLWLLCFVACEAIYFYDYRRPPQQSPILELLLACLNNPFRTTQFFFAFFGTPLVLEIANPLFWATSVGAVLIALCLTLAYWTYQLKDNPSLFAHSWPWFALAAYSTMSGGLATLTRSAQFGAAFATSSRYGIFAVILIVALVHLTPLLAFTAADRRSLSPRQKKNVQKGLGLAAVGLALMHCFAFFAGVEDMRSNWQYRMMGKSWLAFIHLVPERRSVTELLCPDYALLKRTATILAKLGMLAPPPFTECPTNLFQAQTAASTGTFGHLETFRLVSQGRLLFSGWAISPSRAREVDAVVLTYELADGVRQPFTLADDRVPRRDLEVLFGREPFYYAGWQAPCEVTNLPKDVITVRAWGYDVNRQIVWPLAGALTVDNQ
jgi:hypothetical protein